MQAWLALTRLYQGRWAEAGDLARPTWDNPHVAAISRIMALVALGRLRTRRGDPGAAAVLDEALELAGRTSGPAAPGARCARPAPRPPGPAGRPRGAPAPRPAPRGT